MARLQRPRRTITTGSNCSGRRSKPTGLQELHFVHKRASLSRLVMETARLCVNGTATTTMRGSFRASDGGMTRRSKDFRLGSFSLPICAHGRAPHRRTYMDVWLPYRGAIDT